MLSKLTIASDVEQALLPAIGEKNMGPKSLDKNKDGMLNVNDVQIEF